MTKRSNRPQIIAATPTEIALWLEDRRTKVDSLIDQLTKRIDKAPYIIPVAVDEKEYVRSWEAVEYARPEIPDNIGPFLSLKGERMRSKSEVIIADNLYLMGVPYRYEQPMVINGRTVHPDFTVLNVRKRKEPVAGATGSLTSAHSECIISAD